MSNDRVQKEIARERSKENNETKRDREREREGKIKGMRKRGPGEQLLFIYRATFRKYRCIIKRNESL